MTPPPLAHLNLPARDPEPLRRWYVATLGYVDSQGMLYGPATVLNFVKGEPFPSGSFHFGYWLASKDEVRALAAALTERGVAVKEAYADHGPYATAYFCDPEGNVFELFWEEQP